MPHWWVHWHCAAEAGNRNNCRTQAWSWGYDLQATEQEDAPVVPVDSTGFRCQASWSARARGTVTSMVRRRESARWQHSSVKTAAVYARGVCRL